MENINIIQAAEEMCGELAKLKRQVWETTYRGIYPDSKFDNYSIEVESEKFLNIIRNPEITLYVAKTKEKLIGYMAIGKSPRRSELDSEEIVLLYILKEFQGLGVGRRFFEIAKAKLQKNNSNHFIVCCNKYNEPAQKFYKKMGCEILCVEEDNEDKSLPQIQFIYRF